MHATAGLSRVLIAIALVVCTILVPRSAVADNIAAAAAAFEKAQAAELRGKRIQAAKLYELAFRLKPAAAALRGALRMRLAVGDHGIAATHAATLQRRYPDDRRSRSAAAHVLQRLRPKVSRVDIDCDAPCVPVIDGKLTGAQENPEHTIYVEPGKHVIAASFDGTTTKAQSVVGAKGEQSRLSFVRPVSPPPPPPAVPTTLPAVTVAEEPQRDKRGWRRLSPWYFSVAAALTAGAGAATIWSGLDVLDVHDRYDRSAPDAQAAYDEGRDRERRTNILIGTTAGLAAVTVVLAVLTDWSGSNSRAKEKRVAADLLPLRHGTGIGLTHVW